ncbi:RHS repeat-associated core domain-containing protein, partial [Pseudomonas sp. MWU13-3659]|uniref:RHS repeat domain-containing protein n=1 Tax=Pseudomonas sp. MWU13-3659 TaxID=2986964 RepID=UPI0020752991
FDQDPLWHTEVKPQAFEAIAWYQCDHLGTPMELTDEQGQIAWAGQYKAWGEVREERSAWAKQQGLGNPLRFQGQYHDHETGLHYNRYRYYDPKAARFICQDPISYSGGLNLFEYAPNPLGWVDPLGLQKNCCPDKEPEWTPHGYKHVAPKNSSWKDIVKSTKKGPAKYKPGTDIEALERSVHRDGQPVTNGKSWKVKDLG